MIIGRTLTGKLISCFYLKTPQRRGVFYLALGVPEMVGTECNIQCVHIRRRPTEEYVPHNTVTFLLAIVYRTVDCLLYHFVYLLIIVASSSIIAYYMITKIPRHSQAAQGVLANNTEIRYYRLSLTLLYHNTELCYFFPRRITLYFLRRFALWVRGGVLLSML